MTIAKSVPFETVKNKSQSVVLGFLGIMALFFIGLFIRNNGVSSFIVSNSIFEVSFDKFSLFLGSIFCTSLFVGLFPIRHENHLASSFSYYILGGLGIILSNNLLTFFVFWAFQRSLPCIHFIRDMKNESTSGGGTFLLQHLFTFGCLVALLVLATMSGTATMSFSQIPAHFFTWPVLILTFIIIYESHGIFPFHSWIHDMVGNLSWYKISSIFLSRAGVLLFVKFLLPTINQDPDIFRNVLLALSIFSSIYWTVRGIFETNVMKTTTYFYVAQSSLILTGLQADMVAARGAYLHMMVISLSGTALWSMVSHVQRSSSIKRLNQFYGLAQSYPKIAVLFCLFGFCMIGTPLGAAFVVEDLVVTGLLEHQPYLGLGHIIATCLNGILFFLVFSKLFLGQSAYPQKVKNLDLDYSQMLPYVAVLIMMFVIGIVPSLFLENLKW
jgi:NADH-quinone oxidoreductase subunit M